MINILYVDDEVHNLNTFKIAFKHLYNVHTAENAFEGLEILKENDVKIVISDQRMAGLTGIEFLKKVKNLHPDCIRIILTGYADVEVIMKAVNDCEIYRYILKPWESFEMEQTLRSGVELYDLRSKNSELLTKLSVLNSHLKEENKYLKHEVTDTKDFTEIITNNEEYKSLFGILEKVAPTNTTCLIQGETGTGKELIANAIYNYSQLKDKPFVKVNCAALSDNLIESELFGHVKGAFTGAIDDRMGRFELANNGTIFLDEIAELDLNVQAKLLRIVQEGEFQRKGSNDTIKVNVRILAATNRNLDQRIKAGQFREDLYYRLNVFPIKTIPLRKRKEDIEVLCEHFIKRYSSKFGIPVCSISVKGMKKLNLYDWPGNVRELENIIQRYFILEQGSDLEFRNWIPESYDFDSYTELSLADNEKQHILLTLAKTEGKVFGPGGAAEVLDINPKTLISRMDKLWIKRK